MLAMSSGCPSTLVLDMGTALDCKLWPGCTVCAVRLSKLRSGMFTAAAGSAGTWKA